ncbi:MAG: hypothetical protein A2016_10305 [Elusimicrobia bacterium GWF2_62_30]|nr:MAG: hypothetical protein A2016_10305 [Elusimicrobia bacterium GWF2_62_30]
MLTLAVYWPAVRGGYVWDDELYAANPVLERPGSILTILTFGDFTDRFYYKEFPVTYSFFWLGRRLWGNQPAGFHLLNVFLHIVNACLVWLILKRLGLKWAWLAGAVFALHPVHVESVAWITELKNVLSALFFLMSAGAYLLFTEAGEKKFYLGSLALALLALLSKPVTVTLPLAFLLLRWLKGLKTGREEIKQLAPFFVLALLAGLFTMWLELDARNLEISLGPAQRALLAARALWFYPIKLLWPAGLAFSYERWALEPAALSGWLWAAGAVLAGGLLWRFRERLGRGFFAGLWFYVLNIALFLGFISIYTFRYSFVADHYQYLPSIGLIALAIAALERAASAARLPLPLCAALLLAPLGLAARAQSAVYRSQDALWQDTLKKNPGSRLALVNYGAGLKPPEAVKHWAEVLALHPEFYEAQSNMGAALAALDRRGEAEKYFRKALELNPDYSQAHEHLAKLYSLAGRTTDAARHYGELVRLDPGYARARNDYGLALLAAGNGPEAVVQFKKAIELRPEQAEMRSNLGMALYTQGKMEEAAEAFRAALKADPALAEAHNNMGMALLALGRSGEAGECFRAALGLKPEEASFHLNWGIAEASSGKLVEAEKHLRDALRLAPGNPVVKQTLEAVLQRRKQAGSPAGAKK